MLDLQLLRDHPNRVRQGMRNKGYHDTAVVDDLLALDEQRRAATTELQDAQTALNAASKQIGQLMREGRREEAETAKAETARLKARVQELGDEPKRLDARQRELLLAIPNLAHERVPVGATSDDNQVVFEHGERPSFDFEPLPHWELADRHGLIDFERGAKVAGAGFPFYLGAGARLQRALVAFFLDRAAEAGYTEMQPPLVINEASGIGTGQLPDKEAMMYETEGIPAYEIDKHANYLDELEENIKELKITIDRTIHLSPTEVPTHIRNAKIDYLSQSIDNIKWFRDSISAIRKLYLIPTAEVPVTNFFRDETLTESDLPRLFAAYTPCFRREAGSYGKDVRGLNRLHQFDKVELVRFVHPDTSYDHLEALRDDAERLVQALGLPYRRLLMCTGDMGFTQTMKYDLEVWSAGQQRWLEVSSISNFEAYQARRANIRFKPEGGGKPQFVHTLNGSGLALPRIVAALLEQYQQADGSVAIPEVLRPYTGFGRIG